MRTIIAVLLLCLIAVPTFAKDKMTGEDVVAAHLKSLGSAAQGGELRREFGGKAELVLKGSKPSTGEVMLISQGRKSKFVTKFDNVTYPGDEVVCDGANVGVTSLKAETRTALNDYLAMQDVLVKQGLFGGTLVDGWALKNVAARNATLKYDGLKKVNGRELHQVTYKTKDAPELSIKLYFAPESYQHVRSVYVMTVPGTEVVRFTLEELFEDFADAKGLTVPRKWTVIYDAESTRLPSVVAQGGVPTSTAPAVPSRWTWTMSLDKLETATVSQ